MIAETSSVDCRYDRSEDSSNPAMVRHLVRPNSSWLPLYVDIDNGSHTGLGLFRGVPMHTVKDDHTTFLGLYTETFFEVFVGRYVISILHLV